MAVMRKVMAVMLMGLALSVAQLESNAQSRRNNDRKPAATTNNRKPSGSSSSRPAVKPDSRPARPDVKPGGATRPSGPATRPSGPSGQKLSGPAAKPPGQKPSGPAAKPPGQKPNGPATRPGPRPQRPGFAPAPRPPKPPKPPKPVIIVRPSYGSVIAANIASQLLRRAVIASSRPSYNSYSGLSLTHNYVSAGTEYYYQDGVFYIIDTLGRYRAIIPPTGALVEYLPDDYTTFRRGGELFYRVDDTIYTLALIDGQPLFEVLGQLR